MKLIAGLELGLRPASPDVVSFVGGGGKTSAMFRAAQEIAERGGRAVTTTTTRIFAAQIAQSPAHLAIGDGLPDWAQLDELLARYGHCLLVTAAVGEKAVGVQPAIVDALAAHGPSLGIAAILVEADGSRRLPIKAPAAHEPVLPDATTHLVPLVGLESVGAPLDSAHVHRPDLLQALLWEEHPPGPAPRVPGQGTIPRITPGHLATLLRHPQGGLRGRRPGMGYLPLLNKAESPIRLVVGRLVSDLLVQRGIPTLIGAVGRFPDSPIRERWGPLGAVVLAAGEARRFGSAKQLATINQRPLLFSALQSVLAAPVLEVNVVTGAHREQVEAMVAADFTPEIRRGRLRLVYNPRWQEGQSTSMHAGLRALSPGVQAALFMPADQPWVPPALLGRLVQEWRKGAPLAAPRVDGAVRGAPALFARTLFPELLALTGDTGGRVLLARHRAVLATVPAAGAWLADVDTPADLA